MVDQSFTEQKLFPLYAKNIQGMNSFLTVAENSAKVFLVW